MRIACVLPVGSRSPLLDDCLAALAAQERAVDDLVVVDDSPDGSLGTLPGARVVRSGGRGPYAARNVGWAATDAEIVLFLDVRSRPHPTWAARLAATFEDPAVALAGSDVEVLGGPTLAEQVARRQQNFRLANYLERTFFRPYLPTCNLAVRRTDLEAVGGFGTVRSGGDADFCWRVLDRAGRTLAPVPEVLMDWVPRRRLRDLLEQYFRYGRSNYALRVAWAERGAPAARPMGHAALAKGIAATSVRLLLATVRGRRAELVDRLGHAAYLANRLGYRAAWDTARLRRQT